jgi:hypothetical protein
MSEAHPDLPAETVRKGDGLFWSAVAFTAIWLIGAGWGLYAKWTDVIALKPNEIGDVLAGISAPLAFAWLFVSTYLQRIELADTRGVVDNQRQHLEDTAAENVEQTKIMNQTLEATRATLVYNEFSLRLYYLARYIWRRGRGVLGWSRSTRCSLVRGTRVRPHKEAVHSMATR